MQRLRVLVIGMLVLWLPTTALAHESAQEAREQAEEFEQEAEEAQRRANELADRTDQVRDRVARVTEQVGVTEQELAVAREELARVEADLARATDALDAAELRAEKAAVRAEAARERADRARADLEATLGELQVNEDQRAVAVRNAYMYGPGVSTPQMAALHMAEGTSPTDVADVLHMLDVLLVDHGLLVDESVRLAEEADRLAADAERAQQRREQQAAEAEAARDEAAQRHADVLVLMGEAETAVSAEQQAIADLQAQQDQLQTEVRQLVRAREDAEGDVARAADRAREAAEKAEELAAAAAAAAAAATPPAPAGVAVTPVSGGLTRVGGITVASSIAPQVQALLEAARADGIVLGGYGYRSIETTIRLRRANGCPDVWTSPPSSCRVPTARPGTSMHEKGLAIDFTWQGRTICYPNPPSRCHGNAAHDWLRANAPSYGLHGLSSEAWHYSTNGR